MKIKLFYKITLSLFFFSVHVSAQTPQQSKLSFKRVTNEPLSKLPDNSILLYKGWQMKSSAIVGNNGKRISSLNYDVKKWYPTTVPTTVLGVLVRNGIYPDPYIGINNMKIPDASYVFNQRYNLTKYSYLPNKQNPWAKPYWFRKEFNVPADYKGRIVWLNLDGINYRADVWVNGHLVAGANKIVGMFKRFRLNITDFAKPGQTNAIAIAIHPLDYPGDPVHAQLGGLDGSMGPNGGNAEILRNVTQPSSIGWDWVPAARDRNMGIWQHVSINSTGSVKVENPAAFTDLHYFPQDTTADVSIHFFIQNATNVKKSTNLNITIKPPNSSEDNIKLDTLVKLRGDTRREIILKPESYPQLKLRDPDLWWPSTYGDQPLYYLEVTATNNEGPESSSAESEFGVREVDSFILPSGGRAFAVNGKTIRISGGAWISDFLLSWSAQRYRDEIRLMADGNATVVRVNGSSIIPPDVFFEAADKYGLLVWLDLARTSVSPNYRFDGIKSRRPPAADSTIYMDNMVDTISRRRGHPSLLLWCGSNEDPLQENTGKALQNEILPKMDGTRIFLPSSSAQPKWSDININTYTGGPWHMVRLPEYYALYDTAKGFVSRNEIGLPSPPMINTISASIPDYNNPNKRSFFLNQSMGYHDATGSAFRSYLRIMYQDIGLPSSLAEFSRWGNLYNNQVYRTIFEAANKARPRNQGTMLWKSNAAWPSFMWQIYDWNLRPNAGYYTMKSALKPLHIQFSQDDAGIQVVSTLSKVVHAKIVADIYSADGKKLIQKQFKRIIPDNKTVYIDSLANIRNDTSLYFIALNLYNHTGKKIDRTVTWTQNNMEWQKLLTIPAVDMECKLLDQTEQDGETKFTFEVKNSSSFPVVNAMLEITNGKFGKEIIPSFWEDNAFTIMPHEIRKVKVQFRKNLITQTPFVLIEGLNVNPTSWNIATGKKDHISIKIKDFNITNNDLNFIMKGSNAYLRFSARQIEEKGERITTCPIKLCIDSKLYRYVSVGVKYGTESIGEVELKNLTPGRHQIQLGNLSKTVCYNEKL